MRAASALARASAATKPTLDLIQRREDEDEGPHSERISQFCETRDLGGDNIVVMQCCSAIPVDEDALGVWC